MTHPQLFTAHADGIDPQVLEARVAARMVKRAPETADLLTATPVPLETFASVVADLQAALDSVSVQVSVRDEGLLIGNAAWNRIKAQFHAMVVLYVNELAGRQTDINQRVTTALETLVVHLTAESERQTRDVATLEAEIARLREQVETLSRKQA